MAEKTCCVTGHRDIPEDRIAYVEQELRREVLAVIQDGYTRFISGFAEGADLMFAAIVAEQKEHNPDLFLEAAIPYAGRLKTKNKQFHAVCSLHRTGGAGNQSISGCSAGPESSLLGPSYRVIIYI